MKKKLLAIVVAACAACMALALVGCGSNSSSSDSKSSKELRFVTGGESGTYYAYGSVLAQYATNNAGVTVNALSSEGSKANIQSLESNEAELAFCQTDVATYAYNGTNLFDGAAYKDFSVVAALYPEQVQIVTCNADIKSVADLKGKTVSVGSYMIPLLQENCDKAGVQTLLNTTATELLTDANGAVVGVKATGASGETVTVNAKAVVLATGGFGANLDMVVEYKPELKGFMTTNAAGAQGQGIEMATAVGADTVDMDQLSLIHI